MTLGITITADGVEHFENNIDGMVQSRLLRAKNEQPAAEQRSLNAQRERRTENSGVYVLPYIQGGISQRLLLLGRLSGEREIVGSDASFEFPPAVFTHELVVVTSGLGDDRSAIGPRRHELPARPSGGGVALNIDDEIGQQVKVVRGIRASYRFFHERLNGRRSLYGSHPALPHAVPRKQLGVRLEIARIEVAAVVEQQLFDFRPVLDTLNPIGRLAAWRCAALLRSRAGASPPDSSSPPQPGSPCGCERLIAPWCAMIQRVRSIYRPIARRRVRETPARPGSGRTRARISTRPRFAATSQALQEVARTA